MVKPAEHGDVVELIGGSAASHASPAEVGHLFETFGAVSPFADASGSFDGVGPEAGSQTHGSGRGARVAGETRGGSSLAIGQVAKWGM